MKTVSAQPPSPKLYMPSSVLAWPAWLRVLAVVPALVLLWLAVAWAFAEVVPW